MIVKIRGMYNPKNESAAKPLVNLLDETIKSIIKLNEQSPVTVKAYLDQDIRIITVPHNIAVPELIIALEMQYQKRIQSIMYQDADKDLVTIDTETALARAFQLMTDNTLKLVVQAEKNPAKRTALYETIHSPAPSKRQKREPSSNEELFTLPSTTPVFKGDHLSSFLFNEQFFLRRFE